MPEFKCASAACGWLQWPDRAGGSGFGGGGEFGGGGYGGGEYGGGGYGGGDGGGGYGGGGGRRRSALRRVACVRDMPTACPIGWEEPQPLAMPAAPEACTLGSQSFGGGSQPSGAEAQYERGGYEWSADLLRTLQVPSEHVASPHVARICKSPASPQPPPPPPPLPFGARSLAASAASRVPQPAHRPPSYLRPLAACVWLLGVPVSAARHHQRDDVADGRLCHHAHRRRQEPLLPASRATRAGPHRRGAPAETPRDSPRFPKIPRDSPGLTRGVARSSFPPASEAMSTTRPRRAGRCARSSR